MEDLTKEQRQLINEERTRYFELVTSTNPADRPRAESAIRELAGIMDIEIETLVWVNSPDEGKRAYDAIVNGPWFTLFKEAGCPVPVPKSLWDSLWYSLQYSLWGSLHASLGYSLWDSLWDSLQGSLWESLYASLRDSLRGSLWKSLRGSLWESLRDTYWVATCSVVHRHFGAQYDPLQQKQLDLAEELLHSCFSVWLVPGTAILCERLAEVEIMNGKVKGLKWRA